MEQSPEPLRPPARTGRAAQLVVLVVLLGVFGWRVRSCQVQVEEKRRAAAEHEARFLAQTAAEPSPLPLDPHVRRAAMADALRLRPDRRFLLASGQILQLTGAPPATAEARFEEGKWKLTAGTDPLGEVPELPDYPDLMRPLVVLAQRRLAVFPLTGTDPSPDPSPADGPLQWESEARASLPAEVARWTGGQRTPAILHKAARAASSLCFYLVDLLETDDDLAARAIALVALDIAAGKAQTDSEEAVLASALGYVRASRVMGARLQGESSLQFFLSGDDAHLRERAVLREAGAPDRYLRLRRALQHQDEDDATGFLESHHGTERVDLAVLALLLTERKMVNFAPVAFALPVLVLAAAEGVPARVPPQDNQSDTVGLALSSAAAALQVDRETLTQRLEVALEKRDPDTRGYLRAAWLSALRRQGEYLADSQGNSEATARFGERLAKDPAPTVQLFQRWFATRTLLASGKIVEALSSVEKVQGVGGAAVGSLLEQAKHRADFSDPRVLRAARAVVPRLDSRVAHRATLGEIAWSTLQDLRVSERMLRSAFEADPDGHQSLREWFANLSGDPAELERIGRDRFGLRHVRASAWTHLWELGGQHAAVAEQGLRSLVEEDPSDESTALDLAKRLRLSGRLEDARAVLLVWLRANDGANVTAANIRASLARYSFLAGRYAEGLEMVGPALSIGNASSFEYAALNLVGAGRSAEARQMVETLLQRYRYPSSVALAAEVEWQLGDLDAAAQRLAKATIHLTATDYYEDVSEGFVRIFGDRPDQAAAAVAAAAKAGVEQVNLIALGGALESQGHPEAAFRALEAIPAQGERADAIHLTASRPLRKARGEEAARAWLKTTFPIVPDDRGRHLSFLAFREGMAELMWDVVPDPKGADEYAEGTWMLRAAQVALQGSAAPPARKQALRAHYAAVQKPSPHTQIGRYLIGEIPEAELAKQVKNLSAACEVPYYFGVRAQGEKRFGDAADWYRVAVECGMHQEAEYIFANNELYRWRSERGAFSRLR